MWNRIKQAWIVAQSFNDLLESCGSTYEMTKFGGGNLAFDQPCLGQIGKPCDLDLKYSPRISLFCSHSYRPKKQRITKHYAQLPKPKLLTMAENPFRCFLCRDHVGRNADLMVGDSQFDPKMNVVIVNSRLGQNIVDFAVNHKYLLASKIDFTWIRDMQPHLWK